MKAMNQKDDVVVDLRYGPCSVGEYSSYNETYYQKKSCPISILVFIWTSVSINEWFESHKWIQMNCDSIYHSIVASTD